MKYKIICILQNVHVCYANLQFFECAIASEARNNIFLHLAGGCSYF